MEIRFARTAFFATGGLLVWAADFLFLYVFASLACERGYAQHVGWVSILANLLAAGATAALILAARRRRGFGAGLAAITAALGLIAIAFIALPALLLPRGC